MLQRSVLSTLRHFPLGSPASEDIYRAVGRGGGADDHTRVPDETRQGDQVSAGGSTLGPATNKRRIDHPPDKTPGSPVPTLFVWGRKDGSVPYKGCARLRSLVPQAQEVVFDNAKHALPIEFPSQIARVLSEWWKELEE